MLSNWSGLIKILTKLEDMFQRSPQLLNDHAKLKKTLRATFGVDVSNVFFREMDNLNWKPASADNIKSICIHGNKDEDKGNEISNKLLYRNNYINHNHL